MSSSFASPGWAAALNDSITRDSQLRSHAASWVFGPLHLEVEADEALGLAAAAIRVDLHAGDVRSVEIGPTAAAGLAPFAISGTLPRWKAVFNGSLDPVDGILAAQLRARGDLPTLMRHRAVLAGIGAAAARIETQWLDELEPAGAAQA